ncbi:hypothetical protein D3C81_1825850 [compost metagenome]
MRSGVVGVAHVQAHDQRGFVAPGALLQQSGLAVVELDGVGARRDQLVHDSGHVFQAVQESGFVADAVVDGDVQAAPGGQQAVQARFFVVRH